MHLKKAIDKVRSIFLPGQAQRIHPAPDNAVHDPPGEVEADLENGESLTSGMANGPDSDVAAQTDIDWENRTLCVDESCIGVIGPDGRCTQCGKPYDEKTEAVDDRMDAVREQIVEEKPAAQINASEDEAEPEADMDWENRILCVDESCIGIIGPDGHCTQCGKPYENN